ncbi:hypothetical protein R6Q57_011893 [Mikania cordata]
MGRVRCSNILDRQQHRKTRPDNGRININLFKETMPTKTETGSTQPAHKLEPEQPNPQIHQLLLIESVEQQSCFRS